MEAEKFLKTFDECLQNFRKVQQETGDDSDLAHFMDPKLKKFLKDNRKLVDLMLSMRSMMAFKHILTSYIWKE